MGYILPVKPFQSMQYKERANLKPKSSLQAVQPVSQSKAAQKLTGGRTDQQSFDQLLQTAKEKGGNIDIKG